MCSVVQELPQRRAILLLVTNRALYLLRPAAACSVCPPWRLCPNPPKLVRRFVHSRFSRLVIDHSAPFQAGHRFRLYLHSHKWARAGGKKAADGAPPPVLQFSSLRVGVPQQLLSTIARLRQLVVEVEVTPLGMMLAHAITEHARGGSASASVRHRGALSGGGGGSGKEDSSQQSFSVSTLTATAPSPRQRPPARPPPRRAAPAPRRRARPSARRGSRSLYPRRRFKTGYPSTRRRRNSCRSSRT